MQTKQELLINFDAKPNSFILNKNYISRIQDCKLRKVIEQAGRKYLLIVFESELSLFQDKESIKVIIALNMTELLLSVSQICEKYKMSIMMNYNTVTFVKRLFYNNET
jgi:hypothetical protein